MNNVNFINMYTFRCLAPGLLLLAGGLRAATPVAPEWQRALPGARYDFPADHAIHADFKTEWWYFTGTLKTAGGKEYGFELTFFRQGMLPPAIQTARNSLPPDARSRFVQADFKFAHFAISDLTGQKYYFTQKINRGAFGDAGFGRSFDAAVGNPSPTPERLAWIDDWSLQPQPDGSWRITANASTPTRMSIDLEVKPAKPPVIEGETGVSQKAAGEGNASYYYSFTRLKTTGTLAIADDKPQPVSGESWFDHEWASNQLSSDQIGWDWFCFQFEDQTEVMLYAMRRRDGTVDPVSSGTWVAADGRAEHLKFGDFKLRPTRSWHSRATGATYPLSWQVSIPSHRLDFAVETKLDEQELVLPPISYWEGAVRASGKRDGQRLEGHGYMELTGYTGALKGLQQSQQSADPRLRETPR